MEILLKYFDDFTEVQLKQFAALDELYKDWNSKINVISRKGIDGLAMLVQELLLQDPFSGHLFVFRGRKANLLKIVFWDGGGLCLFTKRLDQGVFLWPPEVERGKTLPLTSAQLSALIDGVDWRAPQQWRPAAAG